MPHLPLRIRQARRSADLTQDALARHLDVNRSAVAQWERKEGCRPTSENLARIAMATHVSFEWLATGRGRMCGGGGLDSPSACELEARLVTAFRSMTPAAKKALVNLLAAAPEAPN